MLYNAKATGGDGSFYDETNDELIWVDSKEKTVNFMDPKGENRRILIDAVGGIAAAIPCEDDEETLIATTTGKDICLVDKSSGM